MKMPKKAIYEAIIETMTTGECLIDPQIIIKLCQNEINIMDKRAANAKIKAAANKAINDDLTAQLKGLLAATPKTINDFIAALDDETLSTQKIAYRLNYLAQEGIAEKVDVKIQEENTKSKHAVAYRRANDS